MSDQGIVIRELERAGTCDETIVLASIVRTGGSAYRGVGTRMIVRPDGTAAGLVSGGCLEADLVERARTVRAIGRPEIVTYDSRSDEDLVWGLGLGCDGMVQVLLEPLFGDEAIDLANLLRISHVRRDRSVLATVIDDQASLGARLLMDDSGTELARTGAWSSYDVLEVVRSGVGAAILAGRRGTVCNACGADVSLELIIPPIELVICGSGPDAVPLAQMAAAQGWSVSVVDHRAESLTHAERFADASLVGCSSPEQLANSIQLTDRTAIVVMSHNYQRDLEYMNGALQSPASYVGMLGPRRRTDRMLAELGALGEPPTRVTLERLHAPIGLDVGGDGPEAIALSIVAEISAVSNRRSGGFLRDRRAPIHDSAPNAVREAVPA